MRLITSAVTMTALLLALPALAQTAAPEKPTGPEVSIVFADMGGIDDWREDGNKALYIKGRNRNEWYYARLFATCHELRFANAIGIKNMVGGTFDQFSAIEVEGQTCQLVSLVKSDPPPSKMKKAK